MSKKSFRKLEVSSSRNLTPHMKRVVFSGEDLSDFPENYESGYIKLLFSREGTALQNITDIEALAPAKPMMRTYTVRTFTAEKKELTVDFVLHPESEGPASKWAAEAKPGDEIMMAGPGPAKLVDNDADWFLLAGDMTSLPAISCNLEQLPDSARGYAVLEVTTEDDIQAITFPAGIEIIWVVKNHDRSSQPFVDVIQKLDWLRGTPYVWCACEFSVMRTLRKYFKDDRHIDRQSMYISSYWKSGANEDQHKVIKHRDAAV